MTKMFSLEVGQNEAISSCHCCGRSSQTGHGFVFANGTLILAAARQVPATFGLASHFRPRQFPLPSPTRPISPSPPLPFPAYGIRLPSDGPKASRPTQYPAPPSSPRPHLPQSAHLPRPQSPISNPLSIPSPPPASILHRTRLPRLSPIPSSCNTHLPSPPHSQISKRTVLPLYHRPPVPPITPRPSCPESPIRSRTFPPSNHPPKIPQKIHTKKSTPKIP